MNKLEKLNSQLTFILVHAKGKLLISDYKIGIIDLYKNSYQISFPLEFI